MKKHNFNAGPSILPREVIEKTAQAVLDFNGSGLSIMEISHRAKDFQPVVDEAVALFKELLNIPEGYSVLFLGGGASLEFCMIPFNFLEKKAAYLNTGVWAKKAMKEAKAFGEVVEVASSAEATYTYIPKDYTVPADADYFHVTTNNTIYGTELHEDLDSPVPMIADMSSDIFSRPIDVSKYICIYGGAQKNLAPAGVTFVIVKNDAVGKVSRYIPTMLNYQTHIDGGSMFNTPPVLPIYAALQTLRWIKANGGVAEMHFASGPTNKRRYSHTSASLFVPSARPSCMSASARSASSAETKGQSFAAASTSSDASASRPAATTCASCSGSCRKSGPKVDPTNTISARDLSSSLSIMPPGFIKRSIRWPSLLCPIQRKGSTACGQALFPWVRFPTILRRSARRRSTCARGRSQPRSKRHRRSRRP